MFLWSHPSASTRRPLHFAVKLRCISSTPMSAQLRVSRLTARSDSSTIAFTMKVEALGTLDYIVLPSSDLEEMRRFYSHNLGLTATYERAGWIEFKLGEVALALRQRAEPFFARADANKPGPAVQLAFRVAYSEVDDWFERLSGLGIPILDSPRNQAWGHRTLYFLDPEHNVLEIYADLRQGGPEP